MAYPPTALARYGPLTGDIDGATMVAALHGGALVTIGAGRGTTLRGGRVAVLSGGRKGTIA